MWWNRGLIALTQWRLESEMKELIVIVGSLLLGCLIFYMIAGDKDSLKSASQGVMEKTIEMYKEQ